MAAYLVLLFAVLSRILPLTFHHAGWNFTAVGGGLHFFGSRMNGARSTARKAVRLGIALLALIATDYYLTVYAYRYPFHVRGYLVTWTWYAAVCLLGFGFLATPTFLRATAAVLGSATSFFLISNFVVWIGGRMYPPTLAGLGACYAAAIPFYRNDLVSTGLVVVALFGLPALAAKIVETLHAAHNDLPTA